MITIFVLFSCYATFARPYGDTFALKSGYSFLWLAAMYLVGAWIKKHSIAESISASKAGALLLFAIMLSVCSLCFPGVLNKIFVSYTSPTMVLMAVAYVILFSKLQFPPLGEKIIRCFSPAAFGVYLIHVQYYIWTYYMKGRFASIADGPAWLIPVRVIGSGAVIFITCLIIEKARILLFNVLKVDRICSVIDTFQK